MKYRIEFLSSAQREFLRLPKIDREKVGAKIEALADNPRPARCTKMSGLHNLWRIRIGNFRVVYHIEDVLMIVTITKVGHRRDVYRGM